jgi:hypothetical protein
MDYRSEIPLPYISFIDPVVFFTLVVQSWN